jgi:hypothetical protein
MLSVIALRRFFPSGFCVCFLAAALIQGVGAEALEVASKDLKDLSAATRQAASLFHPIDHKDVVQAKAELLEALARLDARLAQDGDNGIAWRKFVESEKLLNALAGDHDADVALLTQIIQQRYDSGNEGLELVWFIDVRRALVGYRSILMAKANPQAFEAAFRKQLDNLAGALDRNLARPNTDDELVISEAVRWLAGAHQCPSLVADIERHFIRPNLLAEVSAATVAAGIDEPVEDTQDIRDCILGTDIFGVARTAGRTRAELADHDEFGVIDVMFFGVTHSDNVGYHGPVTIFSRAATGLGACKRLWIDAGGLSAHATSAAAETSVEIDDIQSRKNRRIIERMAWRKAGKQQALAECIASRHAEDRLGDRIDRQTAEMLAKVNQKYIDKFQRPFSERKLFPQDLRFSTTSRALNVVCLQAGGGKLTTAVEPPRTTAAGDLVLRIHESAVNNLAFDALAGRTIHEEKVQASVKDLLGELPEKMQGDDDGKPWAITFATRQPVSVSFADDGFRITIRGLRFYKGPDLHPDPMNVSAAYKIERGADGFKMVRQGEIEVLPPEFKPGDGQQMDARRKVIAKLLSKRFAKVFEPEFLAQGFQLSGKWKAAGKFTPAEVICRDGWLAVVWRCRPEDAKAVAAK